MRRGLYVQVVVLGQLVEREAVAVEPPGERRVTRKGRGVGDLLERQPGAAQGRVCPPEPVATAKIRQPGIDPHAGTGCDQNDIGFHDPARSLEDDRVVGGRQ